METRMERYAKYREQIKRMPSEQFASYKTNKSDLEAAKEAVPAVDSLSGGSTSSAPKSKGNSGPYSLYLRKRKRWLLIKLVSFVVVAGIFVLWWFLLQGRK